MLDYCHKRFDKQSGLAFIDKFNLVFDKVEHAIKSGVAPESEQGQIIAKEFWQIVTEFTNGDMSMLSQLMNLANAQANNCGNNMQSALNSFIEPALGAYFSNSGINPFEVKNV